MFGMLDFCPIELEMSYNMLDQKSKRRRYVRIDIRPDSNSRLSQEGGPEFELHNDEFSVPRC